MATKALTDLSIANSPETKASQQAQKSIANVRANVDAGMTASEARKTARTAPRITPESLTPTPEVKVTPPATPVVTPALEAGIEAQTDQFTQNLTEQRKQAETNKTTALTDYINQLKGAKTQTTLESDAYAQEGGVNDIQTELNDINDQIKREQLSMRRAREAIEKKGGGLASGAASEIANLERESIAKQADLSIIQQGIQGRYDSAKEIADRAVKAQLEQQNVLLDALKFNYQENKDIFTTAEQREFETLLGNRERDITKEENRLKEIKDFALKALEAGATVSETKQMMGAKTLEEAMAIGGAYFRPKPAAVSAKAPDLQNFGTATEPLWKQYDPATGQWVDVAGLGGGTAAVADAQKGLDQVRFLRSTITDAKDLVSATGPNAISRGLGNVFVGNTRVKQLQNKIDTLKTNLLTLNSDPNLRKFFGPQMTEKDTQLLMSAGSTLDAYDNSVADNEAELARYDTLLKKIESSLSGASATLSSPQEIITAPDGQEYYFTD